MKLKKILLIYIFFMLIGIAYADFGSIPSFDAGTAENLFVHLYNSTTGVDLTGFTCKISIYNATKGFSVVVSGASMVEQSAGWYNYSLGTTTFTASGLYPAYVNCTKAGVGSSATLTFKIISTTIDEQFTTVQSNQAVIQTDIRNANNSIRADIATIRTDLKNANASIRADIAAIAGNWSILSAEHRLINNTAFSTLAETKSMSGNWSIITGNHTRIYNVVLSLANVTASSIDAVIDDEAILSEVISIRGNWSVISLAHQSVNNTVKSLANITVNNIWNEVQSGYVTAGTFGKYLDAAISGISTTGLSAEQNNTLYMIFSNVSGIRGGNLTAANVWSVIPRTLTNYNESQIALDVDALISDEAALAEIQSIRGNWSILSAEHRLINNTIHSLANLTDADISDEAILAEVQSMQGNWTILTGNHTRIYNVVLSLANITTVGVDSVIDDEAILAEIQSIRGNWSILSAEHRLVNNTVLTLLAETQSIRGNWTVLSSEHRIVNNTVLSLANVTTTGIWATPSRTLTNYNESQIAKDVWGYVIRTLTNYNESQIALDVDALISDEAALAEIQSIRGNWTVLSVEHRIINNTILSLSNTTASGVWSAVTRTLTNYNESQIAKDAWNYVTRTLTNYNESQIASEVDAVISDEAILAEVQSIRGNWSILSAEHRLINNTSLSLSNLTAGSVWNYTSRRLTYLPPTVAVLSIDLSKSGILNTSFYYVGVSHILGDTTPDQGEQMKDNYYMKTAFDIGQVPNNVVNAYLIYWLKKSGNPTGTLTISVEGSNIAVIDVSTLPTSMTKYTTSFGKGNITGSYVEIEFNGDTAWSQVNDVIVGAGDQTATYSLGSIDEGVSWMRLEYELAIGLIIEYNQTSFSQQLSLANISATDVWKSPIRNLTNYNESQIALEVDASIVDEAVLAEIQSIRGNWSILSAEHRLINSTALAALAETQSVRGNWSILSLEHRIINNTILSLNNLTANNIWSAASRTLTNYNESQIAKDIWNHTSRTLTSMATIVEDVWTAPTRTLTNYNETQIAVEVDTVISDEAILAEIISLGGNWTAQSNLIKSLTNYTLAQIGKTTADYWRNLYLITTYNFNATHTLNTTFVFNDTIKVVEKYDYDAQDNLKNISKYPYT